MWLPYSWRRPREKAANLKYLFKFCESSKGSFYKTKWGGLQFPSSWGQRGGQMHSFNKLRRLLWAWLCFALKEHKSPSLQKWSEARWGLGRVDRGAKKAGTNKKVVHMGTGHREAARTAGDPQGRSKTGNVPPIAIPKTSHGCSLDHREGLAWAVHTRLKIHWIRINVITLRAASPGTPMAAFLRWNGPSVMDRDRLAVEVEPPGLEGPDASLCLQGTIYFSLNLSRLRDAMTVSRRVPSQYVFTTCQRGLIWLYRIPH